MNLFKEWRQLRADKQERYSRWRAERAEQDRLHRDRALYFLAPDLTGHIPGQIVKEFDHSKLDSKWLLNNELIVEPGDQSPLTDSMEVLGRWSPSGIILVFEDTPLFVGDSIRLKNGESEHLGYFVTQVERVRRSEHPVPYLDGCSARWRTARCLVESHLKVSWSICKPTAFLPERLYIDDIDSFKTVANISSLDVASDLKNGRIEIGENAVQCCLEELIGESFHKEDWGGEENDLYTSNLRIHGKRVPTAFMLKGGGTKKKQLTLANCGANGDQIIRLFQSPAELFVVQYVGPIHENVIKDVHDKVRRMRAEGKQAMFCVIDGTDTARILCARPRL